MISIEKFKNLLGPLAKNMTEEEICRLRDLEYKVADVLFDKWIDRRNKKIVSGISEPVRHNVDPNTIHGNQNDN